MRGELTFKILETLGKTVVGTADLWEAIIRAGYGASFRQIQRKLEEIEIERLVGEEERKKKQEFYNLVYQLKKAGFIEERKKKNGKTFFLTKKGKEKYDWLKNSLANKPSKDYKPQASVNWTIVIFDIPEKERRARNWLRDVLKILGFRMLQKSVWIGKKKIPQEFLDDLFKRKLIDFVEIFEISKSGTLKQIK